MAVKQFFQKNLRYVAIALAILFVLKSFQSCNRNMKIKRINKELIYTSDSLDRIYGAEADTLLLRLGECEDDNQRLSYEVKLAKSEKDGANKRAAAVQSTAEKVRKNTTIKIENNSPTDTISVK